MSDKYGTELLRVEKSEALAATTMKPATAKMTPVTTEMTPTTTMTPPPAPPLPSSSPPSPTPTISQFKENKYKNDQEVEQKIKNIDTSERSW